ncbi:cytochrome P450 [Nonomuraea jabiensis]|uniref:cytochrome P450 n=1 Tax=Nonomuraea jabiensis TaxID=882448 RepID=UPI00368B936F
MDACALPLVDGFLRQVLRLPPPQWMLTRTVLRPTWLGPYPLDTGQQVTDRTYLIHRDPRWWDGPEAFSPQRWHQAPKRGHYLPFGAGLRGRPGSPLARIQLMALTSLPARD